MRSRMRFTDGIASRNETTRRGLRGIEGETAGCSLGQDLRRFRDDIVPSHGPLARRQVRDDARAGRIGTENVLAARPAQHAGVAGVEVGKHVGRFPRREFPERDRAVDGRARPEEVVGAVCLRRIEIAPEVLAELLTVLFAGCAVTATEEGAQMGGDGVRLAVLVAGPFVAQLVVDRRLVPRPRPSSRPRRNRSRRPPARSSAACAG